MWSTLWALKKVNEENFVSTLQEIVNDGVRNLLMDSCMIKMKITS